jgi:hypothetical protein
MDVGALHLGITARTDRPHRGALSDGCAATHRDRAEVDERNGVALVRADADSEAACWDRTGECDDSACRRDNG